MKVTYNQYIFQFVVRVQETPRHVYRMTECRWDQGSMSSMRWHFQGHNQVFLGAYFLMTTDNSKSIKWRHLSESCGSDPPRHVCRMTECYWVQGTMSSTRGHIQGYNQDFLAVYLLITTDDSKSVKCVILVNSVNQSHLEMFTTWQSVVEIRGTYHQWEDTFKTITRLLSSGDNVINERTHSRT